MSTAAAPRPSSRLWLPLLVLVVAPLAGAAVWYWPSDWGHGQRFLTLLALGAGSALVLAFWLLFLARGPRWLRVGVVILAWAGGAAFLWAGVREVHLSGDMVPVFTFRWEKTHDDLLEEHRKRQAAAAEPTPDAPAPFLDFAGYFGNNRDGVVTDVALRGDWAAEPPQKRWRQPVGGGYAGFAVHGTRAVTIEQRRDREAVVCYDVNSGKELWAQSYAADFKEPLGGPGPRATPAFFMLADEKGKAVGNHVVSLGAQGKLMSFDLDTGQPDWPAGVDVLKDKQHDNLHWGMAASPLIFRNGPTTEVIVAPGANTGATKGRAAVVYDARDGKELRAFGNHRGSYSSPVIRKLCGIDQLLVFDGDGLTSYDPRAGRELWHHPWVSLPGEFINVAQPLVLDGDRVFISSGYDAGCAMLRVRKDDKPEVLWQNKLMRCKFTSPVCRANHLYGLDEGILVCLDAKTGERLWKGGRYGHGQILSVEGLILVLSESGDLVLVEATPGGHRELGKFSALDGKTWNPPALSQGFALVRNHNEMACYQLPGQKLEPADGDR
jgi:outer membrane protein assembly factor BamB